MSHISYPFLSNTTKVTNYRAELSRMKKKKRKNWSRDQEKALIKLDAGVTPPYNSFKEVVSKQQSNKYADIV